MPRHARESACDAEDAERVSETGVATAPQQSRQDAPPPRDFDSKSSIILERYSNDQRDPYNSVRYPFLHDDN